MTPSINRKVSSRDLRRGLNGTISASANALVGAKKAHERIDELVEAVNEVATQLSAVTAQHNAFVAQGWRSRLRWLMTGK